MRPCKSVKVIVKLRVLLLPSTNEKPVILTSIRFYIGNFFLISHSSGDIPLIVCQLRMQPKNYYTPIETLFGKCLKLLPEM